MDGLYLLVDGCIADMDPSALAKVCGARRSQYQDFNIQVYDKFSMSVYEMHALNCFLVAFYCENCILYCVKSVMKDDHNHKADKPIMKMFSYFCILYSLLVYYDIHQLKCCQRAQSCDDQGDKKM